MSSRPLNGTSKAARWGRRTAIWCGAVVAGGVGVLSAYGQDPEPPAPLPGVAAPSPLPALPDAPGVEPAAPMIMPVATQPPANPTAPPTAEPIEPVPMPLTPQPPAPGGDPNQPPIAPPPTPEPEPPAEPEPAPPATPPGPLFNRERDTTGIVPTRPPGPPEHRPTAAVAQKVGELIELMQDPEAEISLVVGRSKIIQLRKVPTRIALSDPTVANIQSLPVQASGTGPATSQPESEADKKLLLLVGSRFGSTSLTVWDEANQPVTFLVRVTIDTLDLESRIKSIFPGSDVRLRQVAGQVILEGQVPDNKTMSEVVDLVVSTLRIGSISTAGGAVGGPIGGQPTGGAIAGGLTNGAGVLGVLINRIRVPGPRQVMLKVKIAELNRTAIREIGANWINNRNNSILASTPANFASISGTGNTIQNSSFVPRNFTRPSTSGPGSVTGGLIAPVASAFNAVSQASGTPDSQLFGIFNAGQFNLFINALRNNNLAKILAEPTLMTLDGQPARFIAGGEFPYPVPQFGQGGAGGAAVITVQFRPFGALLTFVPYIQADDVIRLDVEPNFSQLNFGAGTSVAGTTVPGINQRSARTTVELREGQTLAIAGLLQTTTNAFSTRIPLLGDAPIVGQLFSRNRIETVETELVVLVTPELVEPMDKGEVPAGPGERLMEPNDYEFYFLGRTEGKTGIPHRSTIQHLDPWDVMKHFRSENQWVVGPHGHAD